MRPGTRVHCRSRKRSGTRAQIKECVFFVPLISAATNARSEGYFRREWNLAMNRMLDMAQDQG